MLSPALARVSLSLTLAPLASSQQFQHQPGWIPGTARWSEGVEAADVDGDGDLDLFFADGEGFSSAGPKRQNVLVINKLIETGPGVFVDESVARLGMNLSNAKGVITGDVNGDGWVDVLFTNAFNTDVPFLYINRGSAQPGFFDLESSTRGLTTPYSSAGGQFGDLDDDGDLDLILCDSGPSFLSGPGGRPHLFWNDGQGFFTLDSSFNPAQKIAHMDIQLVDFDDDWDLDVLGVNRATNGGGNHYLLTNDGNGGFSEVSGLLPATSANCYEAEVGDLDGDSDQDIFFISLSGFQEGHVENRLEQTGSLQFVAGSPQSGSVDDNEVAYLDHDNDGDYDVLIASLGARERLYLNNGALSFAEVSGAFSAVSDSSLDMTVAELDGDGRYDIITAQGESNPAQWANKIYKNTGGVDALRPRVLETRAAGASESWPVVVHAKARDQVYDDGQDYLIGEIAYAVLASTAVEIVHQGGSFSPPSVQVQTGTRVLFRNLDGTNQSATSATAPWEFDLPLAAGGGSAEYIFVSVGNYAVVSTTSGANVQITVAGPVATAPAFRAGGGILRFELPALASGPSGQFCYEVFVTDFVGNLGVSSSATFDAPTCDFENYCSATANSSGQPARITCNAQTSVLANLFQLSAAPVPLQPGLFFYSGGQTNGGSGLPFGNGLRCVGTASHPIFRLPVIQASGAGILDYTLDFQNPPAGGSIQPGSTWNFQAWFRDPMGGSAFFNLSDGLRVSFCP